MKHIRLWHKWLSLIVGIQLLFWLATGLFFNLTGHQWGAGNDYRSRSQQVYQCDTPPVPVNTLKLAFQPVTVSLKNHLGHCFYLAHRTRQFHHYQVFDGIRFDAETGVVSLHVDETLAQAIAMESYSGSGVVTDAQLFNAGASPDHQQLNPLWQFTIDDDLATKIYVHGITGQVTHHDNIRSEIHKLMLTLHFMDYFNTGRFNTPLLMLFGLLSLILSATGIIWLINRGFRPKRT